jgi:predicted nucleic acid-binding protein
MRPQSCLCEGPALIVVDASTAINLNATGAALQILRALPHRAVVPEIVLNELQSGAETGRDDYERTMQLIKAEHMAVVALGAIGTQYFETLVIGDAIATLDDGEAATIAHALEVGGIAVVDERKARRICGQRFTGLQLATTMDILTFPEVETVLGKSTLSDVIFCALKSARMRITPSFLPWAVDILGAERAAMCNSLPGSVRRPPT